MSYINRSTGNARSATILAVAGLHVAAAWAIINGLGIDYIRHEVFNLPSKNYPAPKPQVLPEPPKPKPSEMNDHQIVPLDTPVDLSGPTTFQLPPLDPPDLSGAPSDPLPGPTADTGPQFAPVSVKPRGRPGLWVTANDYPTSDIRAGNEGKVTFRLAVDASGKPTGCDIVQGSGHRGLDAATCARLMQRARFEPARDGAGERVAGSYSGTVVWVIPD